MASKVRLDSPGAVQHGFEQLDIASVERLCQQGLAKNVLGYDETPPLDHKEITTRALNIDIKLYYAFVRASVGDTSARSTYKFRFSPNEERHTVAIL